MSWCGSLLNKPVPVLLWVSLVLLCSACYDRASRHSEICNGIDDDLNGRVDDPFVDADGDYSSVDHCGACGIDCHQIFPDATEVACSSTPGGYACSITRCPEGTHLEGKVACVPDREMTCLACGSDSECRRFNPSSACIFLQNGGSRCLSSCDNNNDCETGFHCAPHLNEHYCIPDSGTCACLPVHVGQSFGCWLQSLQGDQSCLGTQTCGEDGLSLCEPISEEICDGLDNNCNGVVDEDFLIGGLYMTPDHCGACQHPCEILAPNTTAECRNINGEATCVRACADNHVDLDGLPLNGCECFMSIAVWPPHSFGGDMNCDGSVDPTHSYIFVSKNGDDANNGSLEAPVATIGRGLALASSQAPTVIVAQGTYEETVTLRPSISLFGGYRADFGDHNPDLYEAKITGSPDTPGQPVLIGTDIHSPTEISGFTLEGSHAPSPGDGSTTVFIAASEEALHLHHLNVLSGAGANGRDGRSSVEILQEFIDADISALDGTSGNPGAPGIDAEMVTCIDLTLLGGDGGEKICPLTEAVVSGGHGGDSNCPNTECKPNSPCPNAGCDDYMTPDGCDLTTMRSLAIPNSSAETGQGKGGGAAGPVTYDAPTTRDGENYCADDPTLRREGGDGENGRPGTNGRGGEGCRDLTGEFDTDTGIWRSFSGLEGFAGGDGSGGGGGTQGNGYDALEWNSITELYGNTDWLGGAGGGGGSGGCGAPGAEMGQGGGSSIGITLILEQETGPNIHDVRITPARAGNGGAGGQGAAGGVPGMGGNGGDGNFWCARRGGKGGDGGEGGKGGGGGGGCGGSISGFHVVTGVGIDGNAYLQSLKNSNHVDPLPSPGSAGNGGFSPGLPGEDGLAGTGESYRIWPLMNGSNGPN